jgi:hypothetical protein
MRFVLFAFVSTAFLFAACHDHEHDAYDNFQKCFEDHTMVEALPVDQAIVICCIEHPLGSAPQNTACGADAQACVTFVTANVAAGTATAAQITMGCDEYVTQRGM